MTNGRYAIIDSILAKFIFVVENHGIGIILPCICYKQHQSWLTGCVALGMTPFFLLRRLDSITTKHLFISNSIFQFDLIYCAYICVCACMRLTECYISFTIFTWSFRFKYTNMKYISLRDTKTDIHIAIVNERMKWDAMICFRIE